MMDNNSESKDNSGELKTNNSELKDSAKQLIQGNKDAFRSLAPFLNLGIQMAATIGAFVLLGWWLDGRFDKSPLFTLVFSFVGIFGAFYSFFRAVTKKE